MPNYAYKGLDSQGQQVSGEVAAEDEHSALVHIKSTGVYPTQLRIVGDGRSRIGSSSISSGIPKISGRVGSGDLTVFSRQLANLVSSGLPLMRTFVALTEHTENQRLKAALLRIQQEVKAGKALWEALDTHSNIFPSLYVSMVKAGEASGQLASVLQWLADYLEKEQARRVQIRSALAYPTLLVTVGSLAVFMLITLVVPKFVTIFEEFGQALPLPTRIMLALSTLLSHWWWALILVAGGIVFGMKAYARTTTGRLNIDRLKLRVFLLGKLTLKTSVSRFARTTATLLQGGVSLFDAMAIVRNVVGNEVLARGIDLARAGMREGESFATRLRETNVFPPLLTHMAGVGEETGDLQGALTTVANAYDTEVDATLKSIVSLLEPVIIITVGGIIAFIILAMLLPVFQINLMTG